MDPSSLQNQDMGLENMLGGCPKPQQADKKPRPQPEQALNCPRCDSTNTKFCYYNNYSLSQPRYFCKSCRRYWTKGGTLRNVPVGGGCRKNKRSSTSSSRRPQDQQQPLLINNATSSFSYDSSNIDLSLAFARLQNKNQLILPPDHPFDNYDTQFGVFNPHHLAYNANPMSNAASSAYFGDNNNGEIHLYNYGEATNTTTVKQEYMEGISNDCLRRKEEGENNLGAWGSSLPWQNMSGMFGGVEDDGINSNNVELSGGGRQSWNGIGSSSAAASWHGLINTPLI